MCRRVSWIGGLTMLAIGMASPSAAASATGAPRFESAACGFEGVDSAWARKQHVECGWLHVPETRGAAPGRMIKLWVAIARADGGKRAADPILYLHGGPGIATVDTWFPFFPDSVAWGAFRKTRDIVFFDQRGTGRSEPKFCPGLSERLHQLDGDDRPPAQLLDAAVQAYADCRREMQDSGVDFAGYNSMATVHDAEDLRRALGYPAWNMYGTSYGTFVALLSLRHHPSSIRSTILDSPYPPNSVAWAEQVTTTAKAYEAVERACRADTDCVGRFPDISGRLANAVQRLDAHPIAGEDGPIDGSDFVGTLWTMLVQAKTLAFVPLAIDHAAAGDDAMVRRLMTAYGGPDSFGEYSDGQSMAVNCHEGGLRSDSVREAARRYPALAGNDPPDDMDRICAAFQPELASADLFAPVASETPTLLYAGEFDPATPNEDAWQAARFLKHATVVWVAGASHAPFYTDDCTRGIAHAFLESPKQPPDATCLAKRPRFAFATKGMEAFLQSLESK